MSDDTEHDDTEQDETAEGGEQSAVGIGESVGSPPVDPIEGQDDIHTPADDAEEGESASDASDGVSDGDGDTDGDDDPGMLAKAASAVGLTDAPDADESETDAQEGEDDAAAEPEGDDAEHS